MRAMEHVTNEIDEDTSFGVFLRKLKSFTEVDYVWIRKSSNSNNSFPFIVFPEYDDWKEVFRTREAAEEFCEHMGFKITS